MTDTNETPGSNAAETPTAPLPQTTPPLADTGAAAAPAAPVDDYNPHAHHEFYRASGAAIALMVVGALVVGLLGFAGGWAARGAAVRSQFAHAGLMMGRGGIGGQGYGFGRRGMMGGQGYGQGQGQGGGQGYGNGYGGGYGYGGGGGQGYGQGQGQGFGNGGGQGYGGHGVYPNPNGSGATTAPVQPQSFNQ